jgi:hypothetical protein
MVARQAGWVVVGVVFAVVTMSLPGRAADLPTRDVSVAPSPENAASGTMTADATATSLAESPPASPEAADGLRAAALAWSKAFLTGTMEDIKRRQGPECASRSSTSTIPKDVKIAYLRGLRAVMRKTIGVRLDQIPIRGVALRHVTRTRGEAEVLYNLPEAKIGNDNWVEFKLHDGHWKVANCNAPIGGHSTSASSSNSVPAVTPTQAPPSP